MMTNTPVCKTRRRAMALLGATVAGGVLEGKSVASALESEPLFISGQAAEMWVSPVSSHTLRISLLPIDRLGRVQPPKRSIILAPDHWPPPTARLRRIARPVAVRWGKMRLLVSSNPLRITANAPGGELIQEAEIDAQSGAVRFPIGGDSVYGLGEGGKQFDRRGAAYPMTHGERVRDLGTDGARLPVPWLVGTGGWALFFHTPFGGFDLSGKDGLFQPVMGAPPLPLDFFLIVAKHPAQILAEYARLTGPPHMPPVWALGYQQSHRTLAGREEVMAEAAKFRSKRLPCDVLIYLGTGFCPSGWNLGHGSYDFNPRVFPEPGRMIDEMHQEHFRIVLHEDKPPKQLHGRASDEGAAAKGPEDAAHYWGEHLKVFNLGVDGWWADEGDWLDNLSCLVRNRMYWEGSQLARPNVRPYTLNRNGYAGIQRYGWLWSGDILSTWETLREQIEVGLNTGLSGIPYWGTDTGGFAPTPELTGELYVRWFQFSAFCPLFRSHGRTWKLRLPWGWDTGSYGPVESPLRSLPPLQDLHDERVEPICRKFLDLRYRLLPYLYTAVREAHETGMPIMRALWIHYPEDPRATELSDEYLWGPDLLVAPVVEKGATARKVYLPGGAWYDFWTEERIDGGREVVRPVDLATIPIYVRAGAILPLGPEMQHTQEDSARPMALVIYPGLDGASSLYEDDGVSFDFRSGACTRTGFTWKDSSRRLTLAPLERGSDHSYRQEMRFEAMVAREPGSRTVTLKERSVTIQF